MSDRARSEEQYGVVLRRVTEGLVHQHERVESGELEWNMQCTWALTLSKLAVLMGEVGEVGEACQERYEGTERDNLEGELLDVALCAVGWLVAIERFKRIREETEADE